MKDIYIAFKERLNGGKTSIEHISLWNNNVSRLEQERGFSLPAAFLEIEPISWQQRTQGYRTAQVSVVVHIVFESLESPADGSYFESEALQTFDIIDEVTNALIGAAGDNFNRWQHIGTEFDHNHDDVQHHQLSFNFQYAVASPYSTGTAVTATPNIAMST
ncbi:MAG: hypothetical protein R3Y59_02825 [bacterium]